MPKKKFIWLFALCCLLPVALAQLVLKQGWFSAGASSKGQWLAEEIKLLPAVPASEPHWRLVYLAPSPCLQHCQQVLSLMTQIHTALGRKQDQLTLWVLSEQAPAQLQRPLQFQHNSGNISGNSIGIGELVLVEHQGLALLQYAMPADLQQLPLTGKAVMADLQKLMKFDRGPV